MTCQALLIDISGKQKYIFSSNKLKLNIGASHIIAHEVFGNALQSSFNEFAKTINTTFLFDEWKTENEVLPTPNAKICVGYIGGGNALLLFEQGIDVGAFIKIYSKKLLKQHRGISPVFALSNNFDTNSLPSSRKNLNDTLNFNKSLHFTQTTPYKHGIESDCSLTGNSQEVFNENVKAWVSKEAHQKIEAAKASNQKLLVDYGKILGDFTFSDELEDISPESEKRYIAVVHIDGNGMGNIFKNIASLPLLRAESLKVSKKLAVSMEALIVYLVSKIKIIDGDAIFADEITLKSEGKKWILPFRPIINAGDDITFVCHGKLGVHLAEKYIEILNDASIGSMSIASCAGIAVFHTKYPFSRIYDLTEQLASHAKQEVRGTNHCSLNFLISSEGYMGDLDKLSAEIIDFDGKPLINQAYIIGEQFDGIKNQLQELRKHWSKTKAIKLREMFFAEKAEREEFALQVKYRNIDNGDIYTKYSYNAIELYNFYPESLLKK